MGGVGDQKSAVRKLPRQGQSLPAIRRGCVSRSQTSKVSEFAVSATEGVSLTGDDVTSGVDRRHDGASVGARPLPGLAALPALHPARRHLQPHRHLRLAVRRADRQHSLGADLVQASNASTQLVGNLHRGAVRQLHCVPGHVLAQRPQVPVRHSPLQLASPLPGVQHVLLRAAVPHTAASTRVYRRPLHRCMSSTQTYSLLPTRPRSQSMSYNSFRGRIFGNLLQNLRISY